MVSSTQRHPCAVPAEAASSLGNILTITWSITIPCWATAAAKPGNLGPRRKPFLSSSARSIIRPFMEGNTLIRFVFFFCFSLLLCVSACDYNKSPVFCFQYGMNETGGVGHVPPGWDQWHALVCHMLLNQPLSLTRSHQ